METQTIRKILTRDFVLVFLAQFAFISVFYILVPTLPIYLSRFGSREAEIGVLIGVFFVSSLLLRPFVGKALLRIPERDFMIAGAILFALTSLSYFIAPPFWPFLIVRIFQGIGLALFHTASFTLVANISPKAHRGQSLSYFFLAPNVSLALIPSLGMFIINQFSFHLLFLVCAGISLTALVITGKLGRRQVAPAEGSSTEEGFFLSWKALLPSVIGSLNYTKWGALIAFFPLYALDHGVANSGLFFTTIALMFFLARIFGGRILDLYSRERVIPSLLFLSVISMTLLSFSKNLPMFILVAVIWGVGNGLLTPAVMAYTLDRVGPSKGPAIGTYTLLSDLGLGLGPVIMGIIIRLTNYPIMFLCLAFTGVLNLIYFYFFIAKKSPPDTHVSFGDGAPRAKPVVPNRSHQGRRGPCRSKEAPMLLSREEMENALKEWNLAWDRHDLEGVMKLFHDEILFENWTGGKAAGKETLRKAWAPWFANHGGFRFMEEETFIDEKEQKALYRWQLQWPSLEKGYEGKPEKRRGIDVLHFQDGKIIRKLTYTKTTIEIEGQRVLLQAKSRS